MLRKPLSEKIAEAIAKIAYELVMILLGIIVIIGSFLYKLRRLEWRLAVMIFIFYSAYINFPFFAQAPKAHAALDGTIPMVIKPDMNVKEIVLSMTKYEFGENQVQAMDNLLTHESGFDPQAVNKNSGACGLFQSLPCGKMLSMSLQDQIQFGFDYIRNRYGNPTNAWVAWKERTPHWY